MEVVVSEGVGEGLGADSRLAFFGSSGEEGCEGDMGGDEGGGEKGKMKSSSLLTKGGTSTEDKVGFFKVLVMGTSIAPDASFGVSPIFVGGAVRGEEVVRGGGALEVLSGGGM